VDAGSVVGGAFDSLLAKIIVTGATRAEALERSRRVLAETVVEGLPTVLPFHRAVVSDPDFTDDPFRVHTRWIETDFDNQLAPWAGDAADADEPAARETVVVEVGGKRLEVTLPAGFGAAGAPAAGAKPARRTRSAGGAAGPGGDALTSPMQGTIVKIAVAEGDSVAAGDLVVVLEAMKMEQPLTAHKAGTVKGLAATVGEVVASGAVICELVD
jgi:acetyl-CoA/propionyl-CoA carboxylase biotin carboxyl carrier protein